MYGRASALEATVGSGWRFANWRSLAAGPITQTIAANGVTLGVGVLNVVVMARLLGPEGRGAVIGAMAWTAFLTAIGDPGLAQAAMYYAARGERERPVIAGTAMAAAVLLAVVLLPVTLFVVCPALSAQNAEVADAVRALAAGMPFAIALTYASSLLQAVGAISAYNALRIAQSLTQTAALLLITITGALSAPAFLRRFVVVQALMAAVALLLVRRETGPWRVSASLWPAWTQYGLRSYIGNVSWLANSRLDQIVLSMLLPAASVGLYATGVSVSAALFGVAIAFATVTHARVAAAGSARAGAAEARKLVRNLILVVAPLGAVLAMLTPALIPFAFGESFRPAIEPAVILICAVVPLGCNYVYANSLRCIGHPLDHSLAELCGVVVTVLALAICVPRYGIAGAALASLIAYSTVCWLLSWRLRVRGR